MRLMTMRSDDQFNTTIYTLNDRFRGIEGTRRVIFMNPSDLGRFGFTDGDIVSVFTAVDDGVERVHQALALARHPAVAQVIVSSRSAVRATFQTGGTERMRCLA